jgi:protein-tyrosine phosphatase
MAQPSCHFILDRLAVGDVRSRRLAGWRAVVSCLTPEELAEAPPVPDGVPVLHVPIADCEPGLAPHIEAAVACIRAHIAEGAVLIHCGAGLSRSASVALAYLVACGMSLPEAESLLKRRRREACPYPGFVREIRAHFNCEALFHAGPSRFEQEPSDGPEEESV